MKKRNSVLQILVLLFFSMLMMAPRTVAAKAAIPGKVTIISAKREASDKVTITWEKTSNATKYRIYYRSGTAWKLVGTVPANKNSFTHVSGRKRPLSAGKKYVYTVRAYNADSGKLGPSNQTGITVKIPPAKVKLTKVKTTGRTVTINWKKAEGATGYRILYKTGNGNWKRVAFVNGNGTTSYQHITSDAFPLKGGVTYSYSVRAYSSTVKLYGSYDKTGLSVTIPVDAYPVTGSDGVRRSTIKKLLQTGLEPLGTTVYVWGGGWNAADTGAGTEARSIGVSTRWKQFFLKQTASYDYHNTRYQIHDGLDCSGYIGWCIYNIRNVTDGKQGYVMLADKMAKNFADRGWGTYRSAGQVSDYRAGDIMSSAGHVYMVVGQCSDGSVVLMHSSPPGVRICGTPAKNGKADSQAVKLAVKYMKKYYPMWYAKFPNCAVGSSYLRGYAQMRWDVSGKAVMTDPDGYQKKTAGQILKDLFR